MGPPRHRSACRPNAFSSALSALGAGIGAAMVLGCGMASGDEPPGGVGILWRDPSPDWHIHGQSTATGQGYPAFEDQYDGPNSLPRGSRLRETISVDLIAGARLWRGGEAHMDTLVWQGFGVGRTLGAGGFPNGEAFKVGTKPPNVNLSRLFLRQTFDLGGKTEDVADSDFTFAGTRDTSRLTFTAGRFSAKDVFDGNAFANDARTQFLNWSLMGNGAWDFPADALGYIPGATAEWTQSRWSARAGYFAVVREPNGLGVEWSLLRAGSAVMELEHRHRLGERAGAARFLVFLTRARSGLYQDAINGAPSIAATRDYREKKGIGLSLDQELTSTLGAFLRAGWNDGQTETWMFTEIDRTLTTGLSLRGEWWHRANDTFAFAHALNDISGAHSRYLASGGTGIIIGDGALRHGAEHVLEAYYDCALRPWLHATLDYQCVVHPAYNRDRGPVSLIALRMRANF
ncbi:MAG: carbohydrate porin [Verrucomicrobia bacterium]|nr:carbohydrate porin [Verrucomicrobiota bacterium]